MVKEDETILKEKYNKFLSTAYTLDFNAPNFNWLLPDGAAATELTEQTKIIKTVINEDGVIFTQGAWAHIKDYIFNGCV